MILSGDKLFFNGKIGKVESFEDDIIVVKCPDDDFTIRVEMAGMAKCEIYY